ncbi:MAG: DUF3943 domain-containing protein [Deltaproteobacteria bacterium]|nr:DUF3943 domain-containing protein [Deltaproteobacteria bacterium]
MRSSTRIARAATCALLGAAMLFVTARPVLADDVPGTAEIPAEPTPQPLDDADGDPTLADLGVTDSVIDRPGLKWWAIDTAVISSVTWGSALAFNTKIRDGVTSSSGSQWLDNISQAPLWNDGSDAMTNYVSHPLLGATWFLIYRSRGHDFIASSLGLVFQSLWLEYVIEGPYKVPSGHDLLFTPLLGVPLGIGLDSLSVYLLKKDDRPLHYLGYLFNPFRLLPIAKNHHWNVAIDPANKSFAVSGRF